MTQALPRIARHPSWPTKPRCRTWRGFRWTEALARAPVPSGYGADRPRARGRPGRHWLFDEARANLTCACQYERARDAFRSGEILRREDYPTYVGALDDYRAIVADDTRNHPLTGELSAGYLVPHGITSMLDAPLLRHGEVVGVICHEHVGAPRAWTQVDTSFVAAVADLVAVAMEQAAHIEARRTLEEHAHRAREEQRMASLGRVAAAVGHDFGHP